ncbi:glucosamine-6-phosphate deaminase [Bacillus pakistanensis]|uniref:Glucosamine-6-phosphate deaminase n=1 Tax=Rossellomorea pakistanensis TaxID=992288 RepID=A0ABS2NEH9_9BACI|nr:glucosamine-6-phosphate deaminase [Bacillus pakistanensis]MBM7586225.1 glucosamine-6-phosphate deaminase [Bacillus pakistanensis]
MKLIQAKNYEEMSEKAAAFMIQQVQSKRNSVLGLATGGTVIGTYDRIVEDFKQSNTSYSEVHTFNLDEYVGMQPSDSNSYHSYMDKQLFRHINLPEDHSYLPDGMADNLQEECQRYEQLIKDSGGIDLQLLGIGQNGHIGFNEPGASFDSVTHIVNLTESTRKANARYFESIEEVPTQAITMGIATIMKSKKILLLVSGESKAEAISRLINEQIHNDNPSSVLKNHADVTIIADEEALSLLKREQKEVFSL